MKKNAKKVSKTAPFTFTVGKKTVVIGPKDIVDFESTKHNVERARALAMLLLHISDRAEVEVRGLKEMPVTQAGSVQYLVYALGNRGYDVRIKIPSDREIKKRRAARELEEKEEKARRAEAKARRAEAKAKRAGKKAA